MRSQITHHEPAQDGGSVLPILLAGLAFLVIFSLTLLGSVQFLQQQRILNSKTDSVALALTQRLIDVGSGNGSSDKSPEVAARSELARLFSETNPIDLTVTQIGDSSIQVGYCEPSRTSFGSGIWGGAARVCAVSRATATE